jgi:hypothetical protein
MIRSSSVGIRMNDSFDDTRSVNSSFNKSFNSIRRDLSQKRGGSITKKDLKMEKEMLI